MFVAVKTIQSYSSGKLPGPQAPDTNRRAASAELLYLARGAPVPAGNKQRNFEKRRARAVRNLQAPDDKRRAAAAKWAKP